MNRLPGFDFQTRKSELIAFSILGAVALSLIGFVVNDASRFVERRDCIASHLAPEFPQNATHMLARSQSNHLFLNSVREPGPEDQLRETHATPSKPQG